MKLLQITALLLVTALPILHSEASTIHILVLDGKTGKPITGRLVEVRPPPDPTSQPLLIGKTDLQGVLEIDTQKLPAKIAVSVKKFLLCRGNYGGQSIHSVTEIISLGVVESNDCSVKTLYDRQPGTLVLFVRREKFSEFFDEVGTLQIPKLQSLLF